MLHALGRDHGARSLGGAGGHGSRRRGKTSPLSAGSSSAILRVEAHAYCSVRTGCRGDRLTQRLPRPCSGRG